MRLIIALITGVTLVVAIAFVRLKSWTLSEADYDQFQHGLWRLKQLDTTFKEGVLEARFGLLDNYDVFQAYDEEEQQLVQLLGNPPTGIDPRGRAAIENSLRKFAGLLKERQSLFERFKTQNAMLANSRRYLPVALDELASRLGSTGDDQELSGIVSDIARLALVRLSSPEEFLRGASERLKRLKDWLVAHPNRHEARLASSLIRHVQNLVSGSADVDALTRRLLELSTAERLEKLVQAYETKVKLALRRAKYFRIVLYGFGMLWLAGIGVTLVALRAANNRLEQRVEERTRELEGEITERKRTEVELVAAHKQLVQISRQAGMAEVATGVLHNVGNVLNSANVSATLLGDRLRKSKAPAFVKIAALVKQQESDLSNFFQNDPRARQLPGYMEQFGQYLTSEQQAMLVEVENLRKNIEHIKEIVAMQQSYGKVSGVIERVSPADLIEDTLRMNAETFDRHSIQVFKEMEEVPPVPLDKHKVLQILVNFVRNAKYACDDSGSTDKRIVLRLRQQANRVQFTVIDNGVGIPAENLARIFNHGFTTRKNGHGFGLHSGANAAREMGGAITVLSEGPGCGSSFTLELPFA